METNESDYSISMGQVEDSELFESIQKGRVRSSHPD